MEVDTLIFSQANSFKGLKNSEVYYWKNKFYLISDSEYDIIPKNLLFAHYQNIDCQKCADREFLVSEKKEIQDSLNLFKAYHRLYRVKNIQAEYKSVFIYDAINSYSNYDFFDDYEDGLSVKKLEEDGEYNFEYQIYELNKGFKDGLRIGHILSNECVSIQVFEVFTYKSFVKEIDSKLSPCENNKVSLKFNREDLEEHYW